MSAKLSKIPLFILLVVSILLVFASGASAYDPGDVTPIPLGPETVLPDYIGAPAKAHPTANSGVPQNPYLAPYPFTHGHSDIWMSDVVDIAGPLGWDPIILTSSLGRSPDSASWLIPSGNLAFDSQGRPILFTYGLQEAAIIMLDPDTLEVLTSYPLDVQPGPPMGEGDQKFLLSMWSIYGYVDNLDQIHIVTGGKKIIVLREADSPSGPVFEPTDEEYDLTDLLEGPNDRMSGVMVDFHGRYWINKGGTSTIYLLNPKTAKPPYNDLPQVNLSAGESTRNGMALTKEGTAYIVTTQQMYRVDAGADDQPYVVWSMPYETNGEVRSGQYELGSGTTPTILGEGKYVAITDNAEQMHVVVYRTDARLKKSEERVVCKVPVFNFPGGGAGANSNSLIGIHNSLVVQNTYGYLFDWVSGTLKNPGAAGYERIDIDPNGKGCTKVWSNTEVATTQAGKYSTKTGLIYTHNRKYDTENDVNVYYYTAIDFRTGEVVWEKRMGTGDKFDNWYAPIGVGPNGALYGTVYGGVTMIRDTR